MFDYPLWVALLLYGLTLASHYLRAKNKPALWPVPMAVLLLFLLYVGYLSLIGLLALLFLALLCWLSHHHQVVVKHVSLLLGMLLFLMMGMHVVPGFDNPQLLNQQLVKVHSVPFTWYINFDKGLAGALLLLMVVLPRSAKASPAVFKVVATVSLVLSILLLALALIFGLVEWNTQQLLGMEFWWLFLINQIMFVALAEEVFFRGVIQTSLQNWLRPKYRLGDYLALIIAAVFFGGVHFAGGWGMVVAATIAGLGYGLVYLKSQRIEAAIAVHVLVNMIHLTGFSYPLLHQ